MKFHVVAVLVILLEVILPGCQKPVLLLNNERPDVPVQPNNDILVDASRDGGVWWFPQSSDSGFSPGSDHQGKSMADYLRSMGYNVEELPRGTLITDSILNKYDRVIRAAAFGNYTPSEIEAYDHFVNRESSLILLEDHLLNSPNDNLSEHLGIQFEGGLDGYITEFVPGAITNGVTALPYIAGSVVTNTIGNSSITILGSLDSTVYLDRNNNGVFDSGDISSPPVMGTLNSYPHCRIFFMGDLNGFEGVYQPFTDNLIKWAFK